MKMRAMVLVLVKVTAIAALAACGHHGVVRVDSPATPYQAPDISEITGIDEDDADSGAGSGSAQPGK